MSLLLNHLDGANLKSFFLDDLSVRTLLEIPEPLRKLLPEIKETYVVTPSDTMNEKLGAHSYRVPIMNLYDFI